MNDHIPQRYHSEFSHVHPCTSCTADKTCPHIPNNGNYQLPADGTRITIATAVLSNFDPTFLPDPAAHVSSNYPDPVAPAQELAASAVLNASALRLATTQWWAAYWYGFKICLARGPLMGNAQCP